MKCAIITVSLVALVALAVAAYYRRLIRIYARALTYEQRRRSHPTSIALTA